MHGRCDRCGLRGPIEGYADEICTWCGHVPLCEHCYDLHTEEVRLDDSTR